MAELILRLTREEVQQKLDFNLLCHTRHSAVAWETGRRRRRWAAEFTPDERERAEAIFALCSRWALKTGPKPVEMSLDTYGLWQRLIRFCGTL